VKHDLKVGADFGDRARARPLSAMDYCTSIAPVVSALLSDEKDVMLRALVWLGKISWNEVFIPEKVLEAAQFIDLPQYQHASKPIRERSKRAKAADRVGSRDDQISPDRACAVLQARKATLVSQIDDRYKPVEDALSCALTRLREVKEADKMIVGDKFKSLMWMPTLPVLAVADEAMRLYTERLHALEREVPSPMTDMDKQLAQAFHGQAAHANLMRKHLDTPSMRKQLASDLDLKENDGSSSRRNDTAVIGLVPAGAHPRAEDGISADVTFRSDPAFVVAADALHEALGGIGTTPSVDNVIKSPKLAEKLDPPGLMVKSGF
jgi:hypothetical protein